MQVHFTDRENGPERLASEAEIPFEEGPLAGTKLVGFCWGSGTPAPVSSGIMAP